ncbi:MAG: endonuclease [Bacteroidales bacterium]|nr:endonuclease [Bacteroidales bacterium]
MKLLMPIFLFLSLWIISQIPAGYYDPAEGLTGESLKLALHNIISSNVQVLSYSALWQAYTRTDVKPNGKIWDIYSDIPGGTPPYEYTPITNQCGNYNSEGDCYNREHVVPSSWFNDASPMYTDLYMVLPTDGYVNNKRGNYPYGNIASATWVSMNGSKLGPFSGSGYSGTVFMPIDSFKGDVARIFFYVTVRYMDRIPSWQSPVYQNGDLASWAEQLFIQWHELDPVSTKERLRNDSVFKIQKNRNPFVDHPEWVYSIWGPTASNMDNSKNSFSFYFDPTSAKIYLTNPEPEKTFHVSIFSQDGKLIYAGINETIIDLSSFQYGFYWLIFENSSMKTIEKIIFLRSQ